MTAMTADYQTEWQLVPKMPTLEMLASVDDEADDKYLARGRAVSAWVSMLAVAPKPPNISMTAEEARTFQDWKGMDGACAFHLIERHANGWDDTALMMEAWLFANRTAEAIEEERNKK